MINREIALEEKLRQRLRYLLKNETLESPQTCKLSVGEVTSIYISHWAEHNVGEKMLEYSKEHPEATLRELKDYEISISAPLEISEEYDEDE